ncbi:hypothetical protein ASG29_13915 [Sphingomonas sp. Leaf412]|uniref:SitI3 family protein n=1 Tax=Sphingomonas sp. Leaf412 TaxID=1736370 RepID=UPI000701F505|nr:SitI3 family protein [Sphingomonas sp. Leaf412]KQT32791.1 hypothetical protein ASG29_13915 [Sphingomonas sp. Leaf412]
MAIEYQLKFAPGVKPSVLAGWLRTAGFADTGSPATFTAPGLTATIGGARDIAGRWAPLGFEPHVEILFVQDKFAPYADAVARLVKTVALLLREVPGDVALARDDETVLALRSRGDLVLTNRDDWWIRPTFAPSLAERLDESYRLEPLPII